MTDIDEAFANLDPVSGLPALYTPAWAGPSQASGRSGSPKRRITVALAVVGVAAAGTAAATYSLSSGPAADTVSGGCYLTDSRTADIAVIDNDPTHPIAQCRAIWPQAFGGPAPADLITCLTPLTNSVAVFPGADQASVCDALGMRPWNGLFPKP